MTSRALGTPLVLAITVAAAVISLPTAQAAVPAGPVEATTASTGMREPFFQA